jgi:hypothetical protein
MRRHQKIKDMIKGEEAAYAQKLKKGTNGTGVLRGKVEKNHILQ